MSSRIKRRRARKVIETGIDDEPRLEARKMKAAAAIGFAGPGSVDKLLAGKKAQGGIYDIDRRLLKKRQTAKSTMKTPDDEAICQYVYPPLPNAPSRSSGKKR